MGRRPIHKTENEKTKERVERDKRKCSIMENYEEKKLSRDREYRQRKREQWTTGGILNFH